MTRVRSACLRAFRQAECLVQAYLGGGYSIPAWDGQPEGTRYFAGQLDEAAFYSKELDSGTVADHYKARTRLVAGSGGEYQGAVMADAPVSYWQLDETGGTVVRNKIAATAGDGTYTKATLATTGAFGIGKRPNSRGTATPSSPAPGSFPTPTSRSKING
ncbi:hypothetical protein OHS33_36470 [Streptomyces sp. NBC_00536]|uniref:hypothetical protein n=1 Tax=Streptomyces sp. NBC_00536 TaxID=2975769 RepID=UPI002E7FE187|nr:hypothetical protein [Streptomyces sp. NBC_00536]WUC83384.1 hypothetical protein OHS33_36470 [Streptomyces sp. NBC_00536]